MGTWLRRVLLPDRDRPRLELAQSLGAFTRPGEEGISPLYVFFEVTNKGTKDIEVARLCVTAKGDPRPIREGEFRGDRDLPLALAPGESARFHTRARALAEELQQAGHGGRPRVRVVAEDVSGTRHHKTFGFRVDEYLRLGNE